MDYKDYYQSLGIARTASADEIRKEYRKLAMKYHLIVIQTINRPKISLKKLTRPIRCCLTRKSVPGTINWAALITTISAGWHARRIQLDQWQQAGRGSAGAGQQVNFDDLSARAWRLF